MAAPSWQTLTTRWDRVWSLVFLLGWLMPALAVSLTDRRISFLPNIVNYQYEIGALFPRATDGWMGLHFLVKLEGQERWHQPPEEEYFQAQVFGHFSRLHMMNIIEALDQERFRTVRRELRDYIVRRHAELHPDAPPVADVRFVMSLWPVGGENARPQGAWETPRLSEIPRDQLRRYPADDVD